MASSGRPVQNIEPEALHKPSQSQNEADVYDLDDPYLVPKVLSQHPKAAGTITCRFLAVPLNEPGSFSRNIAQYGHIVHESRDKLIMRVPPHNIDLMNYIRQAWVSKYLAPFTECRITFDLPKRDRTTTIIIQRVLTKINKNASSCIISGGANDLVITANDAPMTDARAAVRSSGSSVDEGGEAVPRLIRRSWANVLGIIHNYYPDTRRNRQRNDKMKAHLPDDEDSIELGSEWMQVYSGRSMDWI
ncbi:hypothetical protein F5Y12DRAFT_712467 [Xylaria sp. FL1777]|nr:hypothetical protein F5Y12DRAFT_712467 [Xylaria sp. FL1777]